MTTTASLSDIATDFASHLDGAEFADQGYETYLTGGLPAATDSDDPVSFTIRIHPFDKYVEPQPAHPVVTVTVASAGSARLLQVLVIDHADGYSATLHASEDAAYAHLRTVAHSQDLVPFGSELTGRDLVEWLQDHGVEVNLTTAEVPA